MAREIRRIPYEELASNLADILDRVARERASVVVERAGEAVAVLKPAPRARTRRRREKTAADYEAARSAAGSWKDVDVDAFIKDNEASRRIDTRPSVEL